MVAMARQRGMKGGGLPGDEMVLDGQASHTAQDRCVRYNLR